MAIAHRIRRLGVQSIVAALLLVPTQARGDEIRLEVLPELESDIIYGGAVRFRIIDDHWLHDVGSVHFENWGECTERWYPFGEGISQPYIDTVTVGKLKVRARVWIRTHDPDRPGHWAEFNYECTVPPPDEVKHVEGQKVEVGPFDDNRQKFDVYCKKWRIGYGQGWPQEKITNAWNLVTRQPFHHKFVDPNRDGWVPDWQGLPTIFFDEAGSSIVDICGIDDPWFHRYPTGPFFVHDQEWRYWTQHYGHCVNNGYKGTPAFKPKFHRTWVKLANGNWHIDTQ